MHEDQDSPTDTEYPFPDGTYVLIQNYDGETTHPRNGKMVRFVHEGAEWEPDTEQWLFKAKVVEGHDLNGYIFDKGQENLVALFAGEMIEADTVPSLQQVW